MFKKLCILLIFSKLKVTKLLIDKYRMHNLYAIFAKLLNICKQITDNTMTGVKQLPPYVMQSEKEWFLKWMVVKTISVLIRSR